MKNVDFTKSAYIFDSTNIFLSNDNARLTAIGTDDAPAHVYSQSNNAKIVSFEDGVRLYGDASETIYENPLEFKPAINNTFVTLGENATICPGNKSVNCALGNSSTFYTGYELLNPQSLVNETNSYDSYQFLEDTVCFASGENAVIYTAYYDYCVVNTQLISTGKNASINDESPASNNIIVSSGNGASISSNGCRVLFSTGDDVSADIKNNALSSEAMDLVEHQTVISLGKTSHISTDNKSSVIVQEDAQWIKVGINSMLGIMTMTNNRPNMLLFFTQDEEGEYPENISESQKISYENYYRLNENKELVTVSAPNHNS